MARIAGTCHVKIDGANYSTEMEEGVTINILNTKAQAIAASDGSIHYSEVVTPDKISGTLLTTEDLSPQALTNLRNSTVQVHLANGTSAVLRNAFFSGDANVTSKDGRFAFEFTGVGTFL